MLHLQEQVRKATQEQCSCKVSLEQFLLVHFSFIVFSTITAFKQTQTVLLTSLNLFSLSITTSITTTTTTTTNNNKHQTGTTKVKTEVTSGKQGSIKYEHRDSEGNLLTTQEAWRLQNYVFHGINPGKRKLDKRKAKLEAAKKSQNQSAIKKTEALRNNLKHHGQAFVSIQGKASSGGNNGGSKGGGKKQSCII